MSFWVSISSHLFYTYMYCFNHSSLFSNYFLVVKFPFTTFKSLEFANSILPTPQDICDVAILDHPATDFFYSFYYPHKPVKISNSINHWEALDKWKNIEYLVNLMGYRTVPIELGDKYDSDDWCE